MDDEVWVRGSGFNRVITRFTHLSFCVKCRDMGVVRIEVDGTGTLCLCDCERGHKQGWMLPVLSLGQKYQSVPLDQFTPPFDAQSQIQVRRFLKERQHWWREKIRIAEEFWRSYGGEVVQDEIQGK